MPQAASLSTADLAASDVRAFSEPDLALRLAKMRSDKAAWREQANTVVAGGGGHSDLDPSNRTQAASSYFRCLANGDLRSVLEMIPALAAAAGFWLAQPAG